MNRPNRIVAGLDVHKDSVFLCIIDDSGKIFEHKYGVLTPDLD
ncbi:MAG: IS110 family transposase, partial [Phocaeicola sp.]|nr:IS110 family transposase [Phocaeicola sp.]